MPTTFDQWLQDMPGKSDLPFDTSRKTVYRVKELYAGYDPNHPNLGNAFDTKVKNWYLDSDNKPNKLNFTQNVAARLHDTSIGYALSAFTPPKKSIVGFMGGHDNQRDEPVFKQIALAARALRRKTYTIVTGGGPGLMEAANFGAFMAPYSDDQFNEALARLMTVPDMKDVDKWLKAAVDVRTTLLGTWNGDEKEESYNVGIPTWLYGYEPPNLFATHSAKYFFNSVREDGLVTIANGGIIFGPGSAGTVQEIFQDATVNYYVKGIQKPARMVLLGVDFWNPTAANDEATTYLMPNRKPAFPLLKALAGQSSARPPGIFSDHLFLTDSTEDAIAFIEKDGPDISAPEKEARLLRFKGRALSLY